MPGFFSFVIENQLAGMARPGDYAPLPDELAFLKENNIHAVVSLTEFPLDQNLLNQLEFDYLHLPVPDFTPPTLRQIHSFISFFNERRKEERGVVVHCGAGRGRTGTLLACALVADGSSALEAIHKIRQLRPGSIETPDQEDIVMVYERSARRSKDNNA